MPAGLAAAWRQAAADVIEASLAADPKAPQTWGVFAVLLPRAQAAFTDECDGMWTIASYLANSGSHAAARDLCQQVFDARVRVLAAEHPATLTVRNNLARYTGVAGDAAGARDQYAALLPIR